jgi:beta-1,4-mannosyltransferase
VCRYGTSLVAIMSTRLSLDEMRKGRLTENLPYVLVFPWYSNPYQALLYGAMPVNEIRMAKIRVLPGLGPASFILGATYWRLRGCRLLHVHWPAFGIGWPRRIARRLSLWSAFAALGWARVLGYTIVWTAHNIVPHEPVTSDDPAVARALANASAAVIVHSNTLIEEVRELGAKSVVTIPQGSYVGVYPETSLSPAEARRTVGAEPSEFVFLFFGLIRAYKGIPRLVECFLEDFAQEDRLVIAGPCQDQSILASVAAGRGGRVIVRDELVPDTDVSTYFKAANVACLPFERITTSSSILLALSFGVPVVAPRLGTIVDLPEDVGWFYEPDDPNGLRRAMHHARSATADEHRDRRSVARSYAESLEWREIAAKTMTLYRLVRKHV